MKIEEKENPEELTDEEKLALLEFLETKQEKKIFPFLLFYILVIVSHFIVEYCYPHFIWNNFSIIIIIGTIITLFLGRKIVKISDTRNTLTKIKNKHKEAMEEKKNTFAGIILLMPNRKIKGIFLEKDTYYKRIDKNAIFYKDKIISVEKLKKQKIKNNE